MHLQALHANRDGMKQNRFAAMVLAAAGLAAALSAGAEPLFEEQSKETIRVTRNKDGQTVTEQQKVIYTPLAIYPQGERRRVIVRETYRTSQAEHLEGARSDATVDIFPADKDGRYPRSPGRSLEIPNVHEAKFLNDHWTALSYGCCDAETYGRLYTYEGGKPFLRYNGDYWQMEVPNSPMTRYAGFVLRDQVPGDAAEVAIFSGHPDAVACLAYAAPGKPLDSVFLKPAKGADSHAVQHSGPLEVRSKSPSDEVRAGEHSIQLWSLDGAVAANKDKTSMSGVIISASAWMGDGTTETLTVHVENDRFANVRMEGKQLEVDGVTRN